MRTRKLAFMAMLAALASALMLLDTPLPFFPAFLQYDISELPVLIGAFAFGPLSAIAIELVKNLIHLTITSTAGIGELANLIAGTLFAGTAGLVYRFLRTRGGAVVAMIVGTVALTIGMAILNYFIFIDLFMKILVDKGAMPDNGAMAAEDKIKLVLSTYVPFNLFKGFTVSLVTFFVYKPISKLINRLAGA
jgi:riboflavin transporter FmnP